MIKTVIKYIIILIIVTVSITAMQSELDEYKLKSIMVYKIAKQIKFPESKDPLKICLFKTDIDAKTLNFPPNIKIKGREIIVLQTDDKTKIKGCNILYIFDSKYQEVNNIKDIIVENKIFTFGDSNKFAKLDIMISFYINAEDELTFISNKKAIDNSGLYINPYVFKIGEKVIE